MRLTKHIALAASTLFVLSAIPVYAQSTTTETTKSYQTTERGYTANPPGPGAPTVNESTVTRRQVEETKRAAEKEIQDHAQVAGADTQVANKDIAVGDQMLAENKLVEAQQFYKAAMTSVENPHSMSMGTHATANNPNVDATNGMQK